MHSAQRASLKAPASESERRGRVLPPPSPLKHAPSAMVNTTLPTDPNPTRVQELTLSLPGRAGTSSSSGCRPEIIRRQTLRCCSSRCRSCSAPRQPRRLRFGLRKCCVFSGGSTEADVWPPPGAAEWKGKSSKPAPLYARMEKAYKSVWGFWELESICLAIRALARRGAM